MDVHGPRATIDVGTCARFVGDAAIEIYRATSTDEVRRLARIVVLTNNAAGTCAAFNCATFAGVFATGEDAFVTEGAVGGTGVIAAGALWAWIYSN